MPAYDGALFSPPAPLARVTLRHPSSGAAVSDVPMLLDTGADVTLLPQSYVERLGTGVGGGESYRVRRECQCREGRRGRSGFPPAGIQRAIPAYQPGMGTHRARRPQSRVAVIRRLES